MSRFNVLRSAAIAASLVLAMVGTRCIAADVQAAGAGGLPDRLMLAYSLSRSSLEIARVEETFERKGNRYALLSEARAVGIAAVLARGQGWRRESEGTIGSDGLRPTRFTDQRGSNPVQRARLDWEASQIRFERLAANGEPEPGAAEAEALPSGTTDRLSFPYSLAQRGALPKGEFEVPMTDGRRITRYRFTVAGREKVTTPAGTFEAVRVSRVREKDDAGTDVWFAVGRNMIPVRILVTEPDGTTYDQVLVQIGAT